MDILYKTEDWIFSYRVAGICMENGRILLQRKLWDTGFALPGGHVAFGETNEETLIREFREEIGQEISVGALKWVGEIFFPWGKRPCHQICLYYQVVLQSHGIPSQGSFLGNDDLEFCWVPLEELGNMTVYPENLPELLESWEGGVQHFISREEM